MKPSLYISKDGVIRYNEFPEEPKHNGYHPPHPLAWNEYERDLQAAKDSAVPFADQKEVAGLLFQQWFDNAGDMDVFTGLENDKVYSLPVNYSVEVRDRRWAGHADYHDKIALLIPTKEKRKALLIEMMKEDEKNGMYDDHIPDSGKMNESQEALQEVNDALHAHIEVIEKLNEHLQSRIADLESQIQKYKNYCEMNGLQGL